MSVGQGLRSWSSPRRVSLFRSVTADWVLVVLGVLHTLAYGSFFLVMHLKSQAWAPGQVLEPLDGYWSWFYSTIFSETRVTAARRSELAAVHPFWMLGSIALISAIYLILLMRFRSAARAPRLGVLITLALSASVPLLVLPNLLSGDVYSYISFGRTAVVHGGNPFIDPPSRFRFDPFLKWVNWRDVASVYGPGWIYPSMLLTILVNNIKIHVISYVLAYKLFALALHLINGVLIWSILGRWRPEQRGWGTALYLLNPLALIEFAGNTHNDVLMITFLLLGVWLHLRDRWYWTIAMFTLAVLTKWIALPLLGLYGIGLLWEAPTWRERLWRAGGSLALFVSLCVGLYRPYWEGWRTLEILVDAPPQQRLINSLGDVVSNDIQRLMWRLGGWANPALTDAPPVFLSSSPVSVANRFTDDTTTSVWAQERRSFVQTRSQLLRERRQALQNEEWTNGLVRNGALAILGIACVTAVALTRSVHGALQAGAWIFFIYCAIGAVWFWPWYVTWMVALAALLDWRVIGRTAVMFSLLAPLTYIFYPAFSDPFWWQRYRAVMIFVPPLLFAGWYGWQAMRQWWQQRKQVQAA